MPLIRLVRSPQERPSHDGIAQAKLPWLPEFIRWRLLQELQCPQQLMAYYIRVGIATYLEYVRRADLMARIHGLPSFSGDGPGASLLPAYSDDGPHLNT